MPPVASDTTPLINVDEEMAIAAHIAATPEEVANSWKFLLLTGMVDSLVGIGCLFAPLLATNAVSLVLVAILFVSGCVNMSTVCCTRRGYQHQFFWVGIMEIIISLLLYFRRFGTLTMLTVLIAFAFMIFGSLEMTVSQQDQRMAARGLTFFSGILTLIFSLLTVIAMPVAEWSTIGVLLGANLLNIGICRIIVALYGRSLA